MGQQSHQRKLVQENSSKAQLHAHPVQDPLHSPASPPLPALRMSKLSISRPVGSNGPKPCTNPAQQPKRTTATLSHLSQFQNDRTTSGQTADWPMNGQLSVQPTPAPPPSTPPGTGTTG
ncbi:unnamed protein product [Cuscuta europaea]|uniref:Uncharacterized protein n=1 Tax=Cuscuta europaea TaxID=41803 RepID=A0A9P1E7Q8_CUSEU|nr:unnamed protein product [Cuscuta europaea]